MFVGVPCCFCFGMHHFMSFLVAIVLTRKRELADLLLLSFGCLVTVNVMWLFLTVPWVGLQFVFPDHTYLLFYINDDSRLIFDLFIERST